MLVDTHCHLNHPRLFERSAVLLETAAGCGVDRVIVVGFDLATSEAAVRLASSTPGVYAAVGIHPHDASGFDDAMEGRIRMLAQRPKVVALGEIGLDYHYLFSPADAQERAFHRQLSIARELSLPVIVHCREAHADTIAALAADGTPSGCVMHCWTGTPEQARAALDLGLYLGFGGIITFKNAEDVRESARIAPTNRILVETDAPYLAPVPFRGKDAEPAHTRLVADKLADVLGAEPGVIYTTTTANAERLFTGIVSR